MTKDELLNAVGPALSKLRRNVLLDMEIPDAGNPQHGNRIAVKDLSRAPILAFVARSGEEGADVTVGAVAQHLAVDPSVASRMVSECIDAGYLIRAASQEDGRRIILRLGKPGKAMLERLREQQRAAYEYVTADWNEYDRLELARLLVRYVDALAALPGKRAHR
jgi:DNA-binding MarR family transcriptional regulator